MLLCFCFLNRVTEIESDLRIALTQSGKLNEKLAFFQSSQELNDEMTGMKVPDVSCFERKSTLVSLSELVKSKPMLICWFSELHCSSCTTLALTTLQEEFADKPELALVLCSYRLESSYFIFRRMNKIKFPIYSIPMDVFNWNAETIDKPYYFVLHPDMKISHVYVPDQEFPEYNKRYLEMIKRLLSD
jgi:peroxiredoxin